MICLFAATLFVGFVAAADECEPPLVLDSETRECVDLFGLANGTTSAEPDPELLALWNDQSMSAVLWPPTDETADGAGGNVKRQASTRKNWNPIENGVPKNSGPIRAANALDYRLTESIFPVLGLMEIWTNMLAPETPPRRIDHEHQHGCYFLDYLKDWEYSQKIVPANVVMKTFMVEQEMLRIQKKPSITMKFLPSSVVSDAMGGQPRLGFSCAKVEKLDAAMPVLSAVAPNVIASGTKIWTRKEPFVAIFSPMGKNVASVEHFTKVASLYAALDVGPLLVQVALCGDVLKNTGQITFAGCGQDEKTFVYMIAVGYESNGESFSNSFLIVQGAYGKGFGVNGQAKISLAFASTAYWGNLLFMTVRPQDSLFNRFLPRFDLPSYMTPIFQRAGETKFNTSTFPRAVVFKRISLFDLDFKARTVTFTFSDGEREQTLLLEKKDKKGNLFSAAIKTVPPGRWTYCRINIVGESAAVYIVNFDEFDEKLSLQFRDGAAGEMLENAASTTMMTAAAMAFALSIALFI